MSCHFRDKLLNLLNFPTPVHLALPLRGSSCNFVTAVGSKNKNDAATIGSKSDDRPIRLDTALALDGRTCTACRGAIKLQVNSLDINISTALVKILHTRETVDVIHDCRWFRGN